MSNITLSLCAAIVADLEPVDYVGALLASLATIGGAL